MAIKTIKISELPAAGILDGTELLEVVKNATNTQTSLADIRGVVQTTGQSTEKVMSQKAVTDLVGGVESYLSTAASKFYPTLAIANSDIANIEVNQPIHVGEADNGGLWYKATSGATTLTKSAYDVETVVRSKVLNTFKTKALMYASVLHDGADAQVTDDTVNNGLYVKTAGAWVKSDYDPLSQSKSYVDNKVELTSGTPLDIAQDRHGQVYRYTSEDGGLSITGLQKSGSVQDNINTLHNDAKRIPSFNPDENLLNFTGAYDEVYSFFDADAVLNVQKDIKIDGESLADKNYNDAMLDRYTNSLMHRYGKVKNLTAIATKDEDGSNKRMPSGIKTETGLVVFYHRQIKPYDGDMQGSELWKAVLTIDDTTLTSTVVSRELFASPDLPEGIVKHPMLGRTTDNRILLMFEKRVYATDPYVQYQCFSSDEGLTFTSPELVVINGTNPETAENRTTALGTTGTILTSITGRAIVPMYNINNNCYVIYSDDDGINWTFGGLANIGDSGQEPAISFDLNNNLLMTTRPPVAGVRNSYVSKDMGITWQVSDNEKLVSVRNQGNLFVDKKIGVVFQTHNETLTEGRTHYTWSISYDNGKTNPFKYLPYGVDWYGGYCQVLKYKDGVYILIIEHADEFIDSNYNENVGVIILSIGEVISNVNYN